jgi:hypothetical protein
MTILAAVDGQEKNDDVVSIGADLATAYDDQLVVLFVMTEEEFEERWQDHEDFNMETATEAAADTDEPAGTDTPADVNCEEVVPEVADSVEVEGTKEHSEDGTFDIEGRTHGDDQYYEFVHSDGMVFELFVVDDDYYSVTEEGCAKFSTSPDNGYAAPEDEFNEDEFWEDRELDRTETLDGEEMVVYEFNVDTDTYDYELTLYVNCNTRRIHRADQFVPSENVSAVVYYENWGETDPVSPPDMDCQAV